MSTPEGKIKAKLSRRLDDVFSNGMLWRFMPVQMGYGATALDYLLCIGGRFAAIETKADGKKKLTPRQVATMMQIQKAGGKVWVVYDDETIDIAIHGLIALHAEAALLARAS